MILIGMFDSPFVRRVAISMRMLDMSFEHRNWSVGKDFDRIREFNPLGQVPTLVLDDGEVLMESAAILDFIDCSVAPERALLPHSGKSRREALQVIALAIGAAEKGRAMIYERVFRPEEKQYPPWVERCRSQMHAALEALEQRCVQRQSEQWLVDDRVTQADITLACAVTFLMESASMPASSSSYPTLQQRVARCEALPHFRSTYARWGAPAPGASE